MSRYQVENRAILLTGAARGIGADAARRLHELGARVALVDRDGPEVERRAAELGGNALAFTGDVTDADSIEECVADTVDRFGGLDVVIANAGITGPTLAVSDIDPPDFEQVLDVNLLGVWRTVRAALPHVVERQGYVLPIASVAAVIPSPLIAAYVASKHGVEGFARSLRMEIAHTGTRVGVGYFSFIDTDLMRNAVAQPVTQRALTAVPGFLSKPLPVGAAGAAIVRGVERRAKHVYAPRWVPALLALRGLGGPIETLAARDPRLVKALRKASSETPLREEARS
jgi:NAD(P)-dependent dehydrogenase (short-subunit alcohol dehydrogenase family)